MSRRSQSAGIGYVLRKFPILSETFILEEILALEARGVPVHIFSLQRPNDPRFHEALSKVKALVSYVPEVTNLRILLRHNVRAARRHPRRYARALIYTLTRGNTDLVWRLLQSAYVANEARRLRLYHIHAHFATRATSVAFLTSMITRIPYSFTAHAVDIYKVSLDPKALAKKIEQAQFVVTVSDFNKTHLERQSADAVGKVTRIYNGIDLGRFAPNGVTPRLPFTILAVARLVEKKGLPILVEACRQLRDRGVVFRCWIIGTGRLRSELQALIERRGLRDHVRLLGPHTHLEVLERYRSAHLYALPCIVGADGNRDGLPVSIVEALACGLPVVTTPLTGIPEVVRHGHNGLLVPAGDPWALADAIEAMIRDTRLYERLRTNARPSVASTFDRTQTAEALHRLFAAPADRGAKRR